MSGTLSVDARAELATVVPERRCDRLAELSALFHTAGTVHLLGRGAISFHLDLAESAVARRAYSILKELRVPSEIRTYNRRSFDRAARTQRRAGTTVASSARASTDSVPVTRAFPRGQAGGA